MGAHVRHPDWRPAVNIKAVYFRGLNGSQLIQNPVPFMRAHEGRSGPKPAGSIEWQKGGAYLVRPPYRFEFISFMTYVLSLNLSSDWRLWFAARLYPLYSKAHAKCAVAHKPLHLQTSKVIDSARSQESI